jgi:hypothetical protein
MTSQQTSVTTNLLEQLGLLSVRPAGSQQDQSVGEALKRAVNLQSKKLGDRHLETIKCKTKLAEIYCLQSRWIDAQRTLEPALTVTRGAMGDGDVETIVIVRLLERVYQYLGRWQDVNLMQTIG